MNKKIDSKYLKTEIILGKNLAEDVIQMMDAQRIKEYGKNTKDFRKNERESTFFFLKEGGEIKAFGMLKPINIYYEGDSYQIVGLANVIAIEKSKGFGTFLMVEIIKYLQKHDLIAIGNTHVDNFEFYKKCGFRFALDLLSRFVYVKDGGKKVGTETLNYEMFIYDPKNVLKNVVEGKDQVFIKVPFW